MKENQPMSPNKAFEGRNAAARTNRGAFTPDSYVSIIDVILRDHVNLKKLIPTLKDTGVNRAEKAQLVEEFIFYVLEHATAEERSLYVQMKEHEELKIESYEGDTEHALAAQLIQEIDAAADDGEWLAKVKVLAEMIEHHVEEEEKSDGMLDHVKSMDDSTLRAVGAEYERLKGEFDSVTSIRRAFIPRFSRQ